MYLYHTGLEWKFGKVGSLKVGEFVNLLYCTTCGQHYHYTGAQVRITSVIRAGWQCQKCKWCLNCRQSNQDDRYLLCDVCDGAFHAHCLRPQIATIPKNGWKCKVSFKYINRYLCSVPSSHTYLNKVSRIDRDSNISTDVRCPRNRKH